MIEEYTILKNCRHDPHLCTRNQNSFFQEAHLFNIAYLQFENTAVHILSGHTEFET